MSDDDERAFLAAYDGAAFARPSVAVDVVLLGIMGDELAVLLVRRDTHPFRERFALPGGFLRLDESLDAAAARALHEKAGLREVFLEQLYTFGAVARDPRLRVVTVAYYALVDGQRFARAAADRAATIGRIRASDDGAFEIATDREPSVTLAFDHDAIVATALHRIRGKLDYAPIGYELLPDRFTLLQLQRVHEVVAGRRFNKDSFRRRILASGLVASTDALESDVGHRPATLYRYTVTR